jgi:hypothetical protein
VVGSFERREVASSEKREVEKAGDNERTLLCYTRMRVAAMHGGLDSDAQAKRDGTDVHVVHVHAAGIDQFADVAAWCGDREESGGPEREEDNSEAIASSRRGMGYDFPSPTWETSTTRRGLHRPPSSVPKVCVS